MKIELSMAALTVAVLLSACSTTKTSKPQPESGSAPAAMVRPEPVSKPHLVSNAAKSAEFRSSAIKKTEAAPKPAEPMPQKKDLVKVQEGKASWYHERSGSKLASGEGYDSNAMTAAHKSLPMGTVVRVTRMDTGESVRVRINDRGPYKKGRIIDLSRAAGRELNLAKVGVAPCRVEVVEEASSKSKGDSESGGK